VEEEAGMLVAAIVGDEEECREVGLDSVTTAIAETTTGEADLVAVAVVRAGSETAAEEAVRVEMSTV
jgi:hypothetical protein